MTYEEAIHAAAQALVEWRARADSLSPVAAAREALPYGSLEEQAALADEIAAMRRPAVRQSA
jgi:hypothetical protein